MSVENLDQTDVTHVAAALTKSLPRPSDIGALPQGFSPRPTAGGRQTAAPSTAKLDLEIVIPALNEEDRLPATLEVLLPYLSDLPWSSKLIVVDNGCVDATAEVVDRAEAVGVAVEVVGCRERGKGAAIRTGMAHSTARWVGYCDADMSTPIDTIAEAVHQLERGFHVVMASRRCTGGRYIVPQTVGRRVASKLFHVAVGSLVGPVADTQCGLKMFDGPSARDLFAQSECSGFSFDVEIVARAHRSGMRMIELPVDWTDHDGSSVDVRRDCVRVAREIFRVRRSLHNGRHPMSTL